MVNPPAYLYGLESFNIIGVPEPSAFTLVALGGAALLMVRHFKKCWSRKPRQRLKTPAPEKTYSMKKLILTTLTVVCAVSVFAQGTVIFNNRVVGSVITHVYLGGTSQIVANGSNDYSDTPMTPGTFNWSGYTLVSGSEWLAQLLAAPGAGQPESALGLGTPTTTFRTGAAAGFVNPATVTFNNVPPDCTVATIEMVVWYNGSGLYPTWAEASVAWRSGLTVAAEGGRFNLTAIGGVLNPAPTLTGLQSFNLFTLPEPSTFALVALGGAALLMARRFKRG